MKKHFHEFQTCIEYILIISSLLSPSTSSWIISNTSPSQLMSFKKSIHQVQLVLMKALLWGHELEHRQPTRSHALGEKGFSLSQHRWTAHGSSARWGTACVSLPHVLELWLAWSCAGLVQAPTVSWAHECNSPAKSRGQWQQQPSPALPTSRHLFHGILRVLRGWGRCGVIQWSFRSWGLHSHLFSALWPAESGHIICHSLQRTSFSNAV